MAAAAAAASAASSSLEISERHVLACAFPSWYETFKAHTIASVVIPLSDEFVTFLHADGVYVPDRLLPKHVAGAELADHDSDDDKEWAAAKAQAKAAKTKRKEAKAAAKAAGAPAKPAPASGTAASLIADDSDSDDEFDDDKPFFPELVSRIQNTIRAFGGAVFAKLNWSSAKDARWITFDKTLRCTTAGEVLLLLKSSSFVAHDLDAAFDDCTVRIDPTHPLKRPPQPVLVLRRWANLNPSREFRCFVVANRLVAITQRDLAFSADLTSEATQRNVKHAIASFVVKEVLHKFSESTVVCDVYLDARLRVTLIGFKPYSSRTNPLLFAYDRPPLSTAYAAAKLLTAGAAAATAAATSTAATPAISAAAANVKLATAAAPATAAPADAKAAATLSATTSSAATATAPAAAKPDSKVDSKQQPAAKANPKAVGGAAAAASGSAASDWSCSACTSINSAKLYNCDACNAPKPRAKARPPVAARGGRGGGKAGVFRMKGEPPPTKSDDSLAAATAAASASASASTDAKSAASATASTSAAGIMSAPLLVVGGHHHASSASSASASAFSASAVAAGLGGPPELTGTALIADFVAHVDLRVLTSEGQSLNTVNMLAGASGELFRVPADTVNVSTAAHIEMWAEACKVMDAKAAAAPAKP